MNTIMIRSRTTLKSKNIQFMNRLFSTPQSSGGLTPEQVKKEVDKVNRFRKFVSPSCKLLHIYFSNFI